MEVSSLNQLTVFGASLITGVLCGVFFDFQRVLRKRRRAGLLRTTFEDIVFASFCVTAVLSTGYIFDNGAVRYYLLLGCIGGCIFYMANLSRKTAKLINLFCDIITKFIIKPLKKTVGFIKIPLIFLIRLRRRIKNIRKKVISGIGRKVKNYAGKLKKRIKML